MTKNSHHTYTEFENAAKLLGYERFLPGSEINFTLPQLIRMMATDWFVLSVPVPNERELEAWEVVKTVAREFEARGWFEFKEEN